MTTPLALVTGATGYLGSQLVPALRRCGWEVRASGRRDRPADLDPAVDYRAAELAGDDDLGPVLDGVDCVFHLAGASSSKSSVEEMERTNRIGTRRMVAAGIEAGVGRFVHMSSTSVYGEEEQLVVPVTEDVECRPSRSYGKAKLGAEEEVRAGAARGLATVVLRPVTVYGPGAVKLLASAILDVAVERFAGLDTVAVGAGVIEQRLLHVDDLIGASVHLAASDAAVGGVFNLASGYPTNHEVAEVVAEEFGMALARVDGATSDQVGLAYTERARVRDAMLEAGMQPHILLSPERLRFLGKANRNNRLSVDALLATGFEFTRADWAAAVRDNVAWYRDRRWVI